MNKPKTFDLSLTSNLCHGIELNIKIDSCTISVCRLCYFFQLTAKCATKRSARKAKIIDTHVVFLTQNVCPAFQQVLQSNIFCIILVIAVVEVIFLPL